VYTGRIAIRDSQGKEVVGIPLAMEVLPVRLRKPEAWFASYDSEPRLKDYGINTLWRSPQEAAKAGVKGCIVWPLDPGKAKQFAQDTAKFEVRRLMSGYGGSGWPLKKEEVENILKEWPQAEILGVTIPTVVFWSTAPSVRRPWEVWQGPLKDYSPDLESLRKSGKEFWFAEALVGEQGHPRRFTFGFYLWKLGARGHHATTVRYDGEAYYNNIGSSGANEMRPFAPSLAGPDAVNPSWDLVLIREGIADYRYIHTLETLLKEAQERKVSNAATESARKFVEALAAEIQIDLSTYYDAYEGYGSEYWHVKPGNPWTAKKFDDTRRRCAEHILALQKALGK
jgi:hypothetical protein